MECRYRDRRKKSLRRVDVDRARTRARARARAASSYVGQWEMVSLLSSLDCIDCVIVSLSRAHRNDDATRWASSENSLFAYVPTSRSFAKLGLLLGRIVDSSASFDPMIRWRFVSADVVAAA